MRNRSLLAFVPLTALMTLGLRAQGVLALQKSYHLGTYSGTVHVGSGSLSLVSAVGTVDLQANGTFAGLLDQLEVDVLGSTLTPNDPFGGNYEVRPDGELIFDLDPSHPGTDTAALWIDTAGSVFHAARSTSDEEALGVIAIEQSSGMSNASLNGTYYFTNQRMQFVGGTWNTYVEWGTVSFDGAGNVTANSTEQAQTPTGTTTTPFSSTDVYLVQADGSLLVAGNRGAVSGDGELLFAVNQSPSSEVGLTIAVRLGSAYDLQQLSGVFSLTGAKYTLGTGPALPRTTSDYDEMQIFGTSATTGTWINGGVVVDGTALGLTQTPPSSGGSAALAANGTLTLVDGVGTMQFAMSANGRYAVGRRLGAATSLMFAMRQCPVAFTYGTPTAGTGGQSPAIGMRSFPTLGNSNWRVHVDHAIGGGIGIVGIGLASLPGVPALGGLIWVDPTNAYLPLLLLSGAVGQVGAGSGDVQVILPNNPSLEGIRLYSQGLILDPAAPAGFSMTSGFQAMTCR